MNWYQFEQLILKIKWYQWSTRCFFRKQIGLLKSSLQTATHSYYFQRVFISLNQDNLRVEQPHRLSNYEKMHKIDKNAKCITTGVFRKSNWILWMLTFCLLYSFCFCLLCRGLVCFALLKSTIVFNEHCLYLFCSILSSYFSRPSNLLRQ